MVSFGLAALVSVDAAQWEPEKYLASKVSLSSSALFALAVLVCYGVFSLCGLYQSKRLSTTAPEHRNPARNDICDCVPLVRGEIILNLGHDAEVFLRLLGTGSYWSSQRECCSGTFKSDSETRPQSASPSSARHKTARAIGFARKIESMPERGYRVLGFVDDEWPGTETFKKTGLPLACSYEELADFSG